MTDDIQRWSRQVAGSVNQIDRRTAAVEQSVIQFINAQRNALYRDSSDEIKAHIDSLIQRQHQYASIVMLVGYGGLLTLWTTSFRNLSLLWFGLVGTFLCFSLTVFVLGEVYTMRYFATGFHQAKTLEIGGRPASQQERVDLLETRANDFNARMQKPLFHLTLWPGIVAAVLLFSAYLRMIYQELI